MSQAGVIDSLQFAREGREQRGFLDLSLLPRLAQSGCTDAALSYVLQGEQNRDHRPSLHLEVQGRLVLECQRCLGPLELPLAISSDLELTHSQREIDAADDDVDRILASTHMEVVALIEDEAILALPMISMHEHCVEVIESNEIRRLSPFAALATLKKK